ncbi:BCCT family transporter [Bacilliculturomica massiliensis]|uniref:BCCT family transporter n=1 Tax=Bacilliculturomica massiliensis TaxID=1917867 RepID=UPI00102F5E0A|nr:BCCT family transporter [Bacilliculturomica massiliensis]
MNKQQPTLSNTNKGFFDIVNKWVLFPSGIVLVIFVAIGAILPQKFAAGANAALNFVTKYFSWFITPLAFFTVIFCLWAAFSKYGKIRLGGPDAKPKMKTAVWFAITLTSGIAVGINYYGVYEPVWLAHNPAPFLHYEAMSPEAILSSMDYTLLHWALHPYAIYTAVGVCLVFLIYNSKKKYRIASSLYPLLGEKTYGWIGNLVDSLSIFVIIGGIATSLGFATLQIAQGLDIIVGFPSNAVNWLIIVAIMTAFYTISSITGLHKGITYVSNLNTALYFFVLIFSFLAIDPFNVLEFTVTNIGRYAQNFVNLSLFLDPIEKTGWIGLNNVFFNTWFFVFAPLCGLFFVKLAYGRTIREFVMVNLIAPSIFIFAWFGIFGNGSIILEMLGRSTIYQDIVDVGSAMALYSFFEQLPFSAIMKIIALVIVILSFVTLAESMTMSIAAMSLKEFEDETGEAKPPRIVSIFWGVMMALAAYILLITGGEDATSALQTSCIVCGLPIGIVCCFQMAAHFKAMKHLDIYDLYSGGDLSVYDRKPDQIKAVEGSEADQAPLKAAE